MITLYQYMYILFSNYYQYKIYFGLWLHFINKYFSIFEIIMYLKILYGYDHIPSNYLLYQYILFSNYQYIMVRTIFHQHNVHCIFKLLIYLNIFFGYFFKYLVNREGLTGYPVVYELGEYARAVRRHERTRAVPIVL